MVGGRASGVLGSLFAFREGVPQRPAELATLDRAAAADAWVAHMRRGEFERAWTISDALLRDRSWLKRRDVLRCEQTVWGGTPIDGLRVLVRCYRGLGDTLQFIRYAPLIRSRAARLIVWAQPALLPVLGGVEGIDELQPVHDGDIDVDYDVDAEVMELPYICRTSLETIPADVPYIHVDRAALPSSDRPKVGLVWRAGDWTPHRSVPFALLAPLLRLPITWYVLQSEPGLSERPDSFGIVAGTDDILELAQVMASLDLVITIDSMTAHLAGALATPVWTLLSARADWRWLEGRDDTPWYPNMRLFRQERQGEWQPVVERVRRALERLRSVSLPALPTPVRRREQRMSRHSR